MNALARTNLEYVGKLLSRHDGTIPLGKTSKSIQNEGVSIFLIDSNVSVFVCLHYTKIVYFTIASSTITTRWSCVEFVFWNFLPFEFKEPVTNVHVLAKEVQGHGSEETFQGKKHCNNDNSYVFILSIIATSTGTYRSIMGSKTGRNFCRVNGFPLSTRINKKEIKKGTTTCTSLLERTWEK